MHYSMRQVILPYISCRGNAWMHKGEGTRLNKCRATKADSGVKSSSLIFLFLILILQLDTDKIK